MLFDIEIVKKLYEELPGKLKTARLRVGRPLTLTEKILYCHLTSPLKRDPYPRQDVRGF